MDPHLQGRGGGKNLNESSFAKKVGGKIFMLDSWICKCGSMLCTDTSAFSKSRNENFLRFKRI